MHPLAPLNLQPKAALALPSSTLEQFNRLKRCLREPRPFSGFLLKICASWLSGQGSLPDGLGLDPKNYSLMMQHYFYGENWPYHSPSAHPANLNDCLEKDALEMLLSSYQLRVNKVEPWFTKILVAGLAGSNHLWEDLGFWNRDDLSQFLDQAYPRLAQGNQKNMRWKKYIYKQLCEAMEIPYSCPVPSCELCADFSQCFLPQE